MLWAFGLYKKPIYKVYDCLVRYNLPCIIQDLFDVIIDNNLLIEVLWDLRDRVIEHIKWIIHGRVED